MPDIDQHPEAYERVQDTNYVLRWFPNDTIPPRMICASYEFQMAYDTLCDIRYLITEFKHNGIPLRLPKWIDERICNGPANYLSFNSQTDTFPCRTGDTLSFFRMVNWYSQIPGVTDLDGFVSLDTLDYAVELVRLSDSTRIALLDSIGMLPRTTPGKPHFYGSRPFVAPVTYVVPTALDGTKAFMRIRLYHRGTGAYYFTRRDGITLWLSNIVNKPAFKRYMEYYSPTGLAKEVLSRNVTSSSSKRLKVLGETGSRDVRFHFESAPLGVGTSIMVSDLAGNFFYPMLWNIDVAGTADLEYHFPSSGTYLVALLHKNQIQEVVKWIVQ